jgi:hypothetical protein
LADEKKSINFPTVNGTLMDTLEDNSRSPIAISSGFRSGLARDTIFLNEEVLCGALASMEIEGSIRDIIEDFGGSRGCVENALWRRSAPIRKGGWKLGRKRVAGRNDGCRQWSTVTPICIALGLRIADAL